MLLALFLAFIASNSASNSILSCGSIAYVPCVLVVVLHMFPLSVTSACRVARTRLRALVAIMRSAIARSERGSVPWRVTRTAARSQWRERVADVCRSCVRGRADRAEPAGRANNNKNKLSYIDASKYDVSDKILYIYIISHGVLLSSYVNLISDTASPILYKIRTKRGRVVLLCTAYLERNYNLKLYYYNDCSI